ncbi:TonB-dependent receptor plug domain-containing protein [Roseateles sp. DXS20W]|uniref:TonB-dependent receptor plug domain-containing protein n=1 Tax=Pelomonas lactea TaxID=3299030 RepID=A0ABW7GF86_9BURK
MKTPPKTTPLLARSTLAITLALQTLAAQAADEARDSKLLDRVVVTGSNIKRTDAETSQPLLTVSRDEIKASGALTVGEVLGNLTNNDRGALSDLGGANSWASGASGISLRNLGTGGTLTLLNGRRLASYGFADNLQLNFTNIDAIPANLIERVEILKDGASAIYGSDAIGGVINIITTKDFRGVGLAVSAQQSLRRSWLARDRSGSVTAGFGSLDGDGYNVYGHLELYQRGSYKDSDVRPLLPAWYVEQNPARLQRSSGSFPGNYTGSYPANYKDPALAGKSFTTAAPGCAPENLVGAVCMYDYWKDSDARPATDRLTGMLGGRYKISNDLTAFTELQFADIQAKYYTNVPRSQAAGFTSNWYDSLKGELQSFSHPALPVGHPQNPYEFPVTLAYRFVDNPEMFKNVGASFDHRLVMGVEGTVAGWDIDTAIGTMGSRATQRQHLYLDRYGYAEAVTSGTYKFGQVNSADVLNKMFPEMGSTGHYRQQFVDFKGSREIYQLPAGPLMMAVGAELRHEDFFHRSMDNVLQARIVGFSGVNIEGRRNTAAVFTEFAAPITKQLEATLALRGDKVFNGFGAVTPKLQLAFRPAKALLLRGTLTQGFRAPSLPETGNGGASWFNNGRNDPKRCGTARALRDALKTGNAADQIEANLAFNSGCSVSFPSAVTPNPDLKPERSNNASIGLVVQALDNVSVSIDYYAIKRREEIGVPDIAQILQNEDSNPSLMPRDAVSVQDQLWSQRAKELTGQTIAFGSGAIRTMRLQYRNFYKTQVSGVDIDLRSRWALGDWGKLDLNLEANIQNKLLYWDTNANAYRVNRVGYDGVPRERVVLKANWSRGDWKLGSRVNYASSTKLASDERDDSYYQPEGCAERDEPDSNCRVSSWTSTDLWLQYGGIKHWTLSANLLNAFNEQPAVYRRPAGLPNLNGRVLKVSAEVKF